MKRTILILAILLLMGCSTASDTTTPAEQSADDDAPSDAGSDSQAPQTSPDDSLAELSGLDIDEFFEESFRILMLRTPEQVIELGLAETYGMEVNSLNNVSDAYRRETYQVVGSILEKLREYDREALTPEQQVSYDVYEWYLEDWLAEEEFMYHDYTATFMITNSIPIMTEGFFVDNFPLEDKQDAENYVALLWLVKPKFEQALEGLKLREEKGVIMPRMMVQWSLYVLGDTGNSPPRSASYYSVFSEKLDDVAGLSAGDKQALLDEAEDAVAESVLPGYALILDYLSGIEGKAPTDDGVWQFENGDAYYAYTLHHHNTASLSADEIHQLGLQELDRIHGEMRAIFDELDYPEDAGLETLFAQVARDSGSVSGSTIITTYEDILEEAEQNLDEAFDILPEAELTVNSSYYGGAYYMPGSLDGSRPGGFFANTSGSQALYNMPSLAYHEGIPGHHLQIALAAEMDLPTFRKVVGFNGYVEGWALYAERLVWDLGWYEDDPYGDLGRLQYEAFRAARLVVDTGIHAKEWDFRQAQNFFTENTGYSDGMAQNEIGRYVVWPGQSTAYMVGMLKILELRQKAMNELGDQFDLVEFHRVVIGNGSMPLDVLERVIDDYIAAKLND